MSYSIQIKGSARRELARLPHQVRRRLVRAIDGLRDEPLSGASLKGGLRGLRRLRTGDYRIVYELLEKEIVVLVIRDARRKAYR